MTHSARGKPLAVGRCEIGSALQRRASASVHQARAFYCRVAGSSDNSIIADGRGDMQTLLAGGYSIPEESLSLSGMDESQAQLPHMPWSSSKCSICFSMTLWPIFLLRAAKPLQ